MYSSVLRRARSVVLTSALASIALLLAAASAKADLVGYDPNAGQSTGTSASSNAPPVQKTSDSNAAGDADSTTTGGAGSCTFKIKGTLVVRDPNVVAHLRGNKVATAIEDNAPLKGVEVKVSGRSDPGLFTSWGDVYTGADGSFKVTKSECNARVVKVEARFRNDDLDVSGPTSPSWYLLYQTPNAIDPSLIDLQREPFRGETGDQSTDQARTDAQTWVVYQRAIDYVNAAGQRFAKRVVVHNPATLTGGLSATDPPTGDIHIDPTETSDLYAMVHELGHAWSYPYLIGEGCLSIALEQSVFQWAVSKVEGNASQSTPSTHEARETPCVAFAEGFAEFFRWKVELGMYDAGLFDAIDWDASIVPWTRQYLRDTFGLYSLDDAAHSEHGWEQALLVLNASDLPLLLFGNGTSVTGENVSTYGSGLMCIGQPLLHNQLADTLEIIGDANDAFNLTLPLGIPSLIDRANERAYWFDDTDANAYEMAIDPSATTFEPHIDYGC